MLRNIGIMGCFTGRRLAAFELLSLLSPPSVNVVNIGGD